MLRTVARCSEVRAMVDQNLPGKKTGLAASASLHYYNTLEEIERFVVELKQLLA